MKEIKRTKNFKSDVEKLRDECVGLTEDMEAYMSKGYSLEGQKRYLKEWAEFEGMTVSNIYVEPGKSGKSIT